MSAIEIAKAAGQTPPEDDGDAIASAAAAAVAHPAIEVEPPAPPRAAFPVRRGLAFGLVALGLLVGVLIWARTSRDAGPRASPLTLAVLPFTNLSGDPAREYFAEGLAEDTATSLGQIDPEQMGVVAGSSTMRYKGSTKSAAEIGRELAADYIVESSLRVEDNRLRVTATLVRVRDQVQVWSQSYDREPTSVLSLQRELSTAIAEQIRLRLSPGRLESLARRQTQSPDAYDLYLRGRNFRESAHAGDQPPCDRVLHASHRARPRLRAGLVIDRNGCSRPVSSTATRPPPRCSPELATRRRGQSRRVLPRPRRSSPSRT